MWIELVRVPASRRDLLRSGAPGRWLPPGPQPAERPGEHHHDNATAYDSCCRLSPVCSFTTLASLSLLVLWMLGPFPRG